MGILLDARLQAAAELVRNGGYLCDVGSDHAYLPCALALSGKIAGGMAMDINAGPLQNARHTIMEAGVSDRIITRLSDGLDALSDEEQQKITDIAVCGMGGELIDAILSRADWIRNAEKSLILQPMTQIPHLRRRLYASGFAIEREIPVVDKNHLYTVMLARYTGKSEEIDELFAQVGKVPESGCEQAADYLGIVAGRLRKAAMGMLRSEAKQEEGAKQMALSEEILRLSPNRLNVTVGDVYAMMEEWAPFASQCGWDNSGLQTGSMANIVTGVVLALDCTDAVIDYAAKTGANVIITHHPLIFDKLSAVLDDTPVAKLVQNRISLICAHTNLDMAKEGVSDCLAQALGLTECVGFGEDNVGRIGILEHSMMPEEFAALIKSRLKTAVTYWDSGREIRRVALVSGAGSDFAADAAALGADAYLTGELKHNYFADLSATGMSMFAAGHYATERVVLPKIKEKIQKAFIGLPVQIFELQQLKYI